MKLYYDVVIDNAPLDVPIEVELVQGDLNIVIGQVPELQLSLNPRGGGLEQVVSDVLEPLAAKMVEDNKGRLSSMLSGREINIISVESFSVGGISISVDELEVSSHSVGSEHHLMLVPTLSVGSR
ncbi:hypothetical protein [Pseudomonas sp. TMW22091]|uniref:hypothetical protein n=1 Tax=Pseudomonas sp. TMW22091 TaxID=2506435 RepID=UPI001F10C8D4|nr:hypothetical protein [Pseudomonas sp. TMW22091]MCH4871694.1 hypothetical protein [Pseudomonas sp. TMW22091]